MLHVVLAAVCLIGGREAKSELPASTLGIVTRRGVHTWWRSDCAPVRWTAALGGIVNTVRWQPGAPGVERGELRLAGSAPVWRVRVLLVRVDPTVVRLRLVPLERWNIDSTTNAVVAFNAGQFEAYGPWGWVVTDGRERRMPGHGPLAPAIVVEDGRVRIVPADSVDALRRAARVREAFQSYPQLLAGDGELPLALLKAGGGVDVAHRDTRLALGTLRDGRVLIALTRYDVLGEGLQQVPLGPTVPEMAAVMGALGCDRAVLLDGGLSGQLLVRDADGSVLAWRGLRDVPLGMIGVAR